MHSFLSTRAGRLKVVAFLALAGTAGLLGITSAAPAEEPDRARSLLQEAQRSRGGIEKMAQVVEIRREGSLVIATPGGEQRLPLLMIARPPRDMVIQTGAGEDLVRREVVDGKGWQTLGDGGERQPLSDEETARLLLLARVDEAFLVSGALAGDLEVAGTEPAGPGEVAPELPAASGQAVVLRSAGGRAYRLVVPEEGGLPLRVDYESTAVGADGLLSDVFLRWRIVEGLLFPAEVVLYRGTQAISAARYDTISLVLAPAAAP